MEAWTLFCALRTRANGFHSCSRRVRGSPYLRVAIIRALRVALAQPLRIVSGEPLPKQVPCSFQFVFVETESAQRQRARSWRSGINLFFVRTIVKSSLEWRAGRFAGILGVPAVAVNPLWFVEKAKADSQSGQRSIRLKNTARIPTGKVYAARASPGPSPSSR